MNSKRTDNKLLLAIMAIGTIGMIDITLEMALNVDFPILMKQFGVGPSTVQWLTSGVILTTTIVAIAFPWLKQNFRNKSLFIFAALISILGIFIDAVGFQFHAVLLGRLMQGVGGGISLPLMSAIIFEQAPISHRGVLMGIGSFMTAIGPAFGPPFGGWVSTLGNWHLMFWFVLPLMLIALVIGSMTIEQKTETMRTKLDWQGGLLLNAGFVGAIFSFALVGDHVASWLVAVCAAISVIGFVGYVWRSWNSDTAILSLKPWREPYFARGAVSALLIQFTELFMIFAVPMTIQLALHGRTDIAGYISLPGTLVGAFLGVYAGHRLDRVGPKTNIMIGTGLIGAGYLIVLLSTPSTWHYFWMFSLFGVGLSFFFSTNMTYSVSTLPQSEQTNGVTTFTTIYNFAASAGVSVAAMIMSKTQAMSGDVHGSLQGMHALTVVSLIFLAITLVLQYFNVSQRYLKQMTK